MSVDGNTTWSFGDGDYGKLGLGNSTAKATPAKVEALSGLGVKKVACGTQFTVALTRDGKVLTWGQGNCRCYCFCSIDQIPVELLPHLNSIDDIISVLQQNRLQSYGHVLRKEDNG